MMDGEKKYKKKMNKIRLMISMKNNLFALACCCREKKQKFESIRNPLHQRN